MLFHSTVLFIKATYLHLDALPVDKACTNGDSFMLEECQKIILEKLKQTRDVAEIFNRNFSSKECRLVMEALVDLEKLLTEGSLAVESMIETIDSMEASSSKDFN